MLRCEFLLYFLLYFFFKAHRGLVQRQRAVVQVTLFLHELGARGRLFVLLDWLLARTLSLCKLLSVVHKMDCLFCWPRNTNNHVCQLRLLNSPWKNSSLCLLEILLGEGWETHGWLSCLILHGIPTLWSLTFSNNMLLNDFRHVHISLLLNLHEKLVDLRI